MNEHIALIISQFIGSFVTLAGLLFGLYQFQRRLGLQRVQVNADAASDQANAYLADAKTRNENLTNLARLQQMIHEADEQNYKLRIEMRGVQERVQTLELESANNKQRYENERALRMEAEEEFRRERTLRKALEKELDDERVHRRQMQEDYQELIRGMEEKLTRLEAWYRRENGDPCNDRHPNPVVDPVAQPATQS